MIRNTATINKITPKVPTNPVSLLSKPLKNLNACCLIFLTKYIPVPINKPQ